MANNQSQIKRNRQNEKRRVRNSQVRASIRTAGKKVVKAIESKEEKNLQQINELYAAYVKLVDSAAQKGVVHQRTAARKKSRLSKKVNSLQAQA